MNASTPADAVTEVPDPAERVHICHQVRMENLEVAISVIAHLTGLNHTGVVRRYASAEQIAADYTACATGAGIPVAELVEMHRRDLEDLALLLQEAGRLAAINQLRVVH